MPEIKDKIIRKNVDQLIPYPNNPKKHPDEQIDKIAGSIQEYGFIQPLVIDEEDQVIIGHGRLKACKKLDMEEVPVVESGELTDAQKKALRIADNRIAESGWDDEVLSVELEELKELDYDTELLGFEESELDYYLEDIEIDDFFDETDIDEDEGEEKPQTVVCPECGNEIEI